MMSKKIKYMLAVALVITLMVLFRHFIFLLLVKVAFAGIVLFIALAGIYAFLRMFAGILGIMITLMGLMLIFKIIQFALI